MEQRAFPYQLFPLGDNAVSIDWGNRVSETLNQEVISRYRQLEALALPWIKELVPAYSSLTVYYDLLSLYQLKKKGQTAFEWVIEQLRTLLEQPGAVTGEQERLLRIPVCYEPEFAPDLAFVSKEKNISAGEIITLHTGIIYKVYMLGFLPGFAYMGEVDERIALPRKPQPVDTRAGSVGIAGRQTGIYPLNSPGGWQIIGRTPYKLFDRDKEVPALFRPGDRVQFYSISRNEFDSY